MTLPTGTVTFLFTDIEGSTKLWEQFPDQMRTALARHDALLREAIESHNGQVFKTVGDAFCAAFSAPIQALTAVLAAQQALAAEPWPDETPLRVRMALHTGAAEERDNDYFGSCINRVARLLAIGHGGQVLLSEVTEGLVRESLPEGCRLQDLGSHRLKDLQLPEHVFALLSLDLPSDFPPLRSLQAYANNLPVQLTSFIGREKEMKEVQRLLEATHLLTLTGSGGCGKTRLALQVAAELVEDYADGVWLVELAALSDPALMPQAVATSLGLREEPGRPLTQTVTDYLFPKSALLLLDNCEHLLPACAGLVDTLLKACPHLCVLATSREALGMAGEQVYRVPSLLAPDPAALPSEEKEWTTIVSEYDAVCLFVVRAGMQKSEFALTRQNARAVASVCHRLDGIPLAIELAAARVRVLSVEEIDTRLEDRFRLLTGGSQTALPRQRTLRAAIDWSYDLLSAQERTLLSRLSVFAGGWGLEAAEAVCAEEGREDWEVLDLLTGLVDKSLVIAEERTGTSRYRLLETVRQYSRERLVQAGEEAQIRGRHLEYYLALAEEAEPKLTGPEQGEWLGRLEAEHDNLRAALAWCQTEDEGAEAGLRLGGALYRFWHVRGHFSEGRSYLTEAFGHKRAIGHDRERAKALGGAGFLAYAQGDYEAARSLHEESLSICRELGDKQGIAQSFNNLGNVAFSQGEYDSARALYEESLSIRRELGDKQGIASSLHNLGGVAKEQGDYGSARALYEESLTILRDLGNKQGIAQSLNNLGNVAVYQGDYEASRRLYEESLTLRRELGDKRGIAQSLHNLGIVVMDQADHSSARSLSEESLSIQRELGDKWGIAQSLISLGNAAYSQGDYEASRRLYEESLVIYRELGDKQGIAQSLNNLGIVAKEQGDYVSARALYEESLVIYRELGDKRGIAQSLHNLGSVAFSQGDYAAARTLHEESLAIKQELGDKQGIAQSLEAFAGLARAEAQPERAARAWAAAEALREEIGSPLTPNDREEYDRNVAAAREALDAEAFAAAWAEGRAMTLEQAIAYALKEEA